MRPWLTAIAALAVAGCATTPSTSAPGPDREPVSVRAPDGGSYTLHLEREDRRFRGRIDVPIEDAWSQLPGVYGDLGLQPEDFTEYLPGARRLSATASNIRQLGGQRLSTYIDCGHSMTSPKADAGQVQLTLSTWLEPADGGTEVVTQLEASARDSGASTRPVPCSSRGEIERRIMKRLLLESLRGG